MPGMPEVAKATVTIIPNMQGSQKKIAEELGIATKDSGKNAGNNIGDSLIGAIKKVVGVAAIGKMIGDTISKGADLQQSLGGIETLFKENADIVKGYAADAYKTAGLSANDYMESVTSFSAALIKSMDDDSAAAAELANTAMIDMADNANKMGTDMSSIQSAYQGFAKQNYTMLDNLKLGYGGTKSEMERLLADASKLSGVEYNIDNLDDVYNAIHIIQEDLGITGATAAEAATTFSGSMASMKAAADNVMAKIAIGEPIAKDLAALSESVKTFVVGNLLPMVGNVITQLPSIIAQIPGFVADIFPDLLSGVVDIITGLADAIVDNAPAFVAGIGELFTAIQEGFASIDWVSVANTMLDGLSAAIGAIWDSVVSLLQAQFGIELPDWNTVVEDISTLWENVKSGIAGFFTAAFDIIMDDDKTITEKISALWDLVKAGIGDMFKAWFSVYLPAYESVISAISDWWGANIWPAIQDFFKATFGIEIPDWETIVEPIKECWEKVKADIANLFNVVFGVDTPSAADVIEAINQLWTDVWNGITGWFNATFNLKIPTWEDVREKITKFWNDIKAGISGFFKKTFNVTMPSWESIQEKIKTGWETVKKGVGNVFSWLFSLDFPSVDEIVGKLKEWWNKIVAGIGDFFTLKWILGDNSEEEVKEQFGGGGRKFELVGDDVTVDSKAIQDALSNANLTLADIDTSSLDTALASVTTCISGMEKAFENANFVLPAVRTATLTVAKAAVTKAVASMQSTMNFSWTLPTLHGHLPIISVNMRSASSSDGRTHVSYPDLTVGGYRWFAEGGIFNKPTVIGIGDSQGPEAAVPLDMMWRKLGTEIDKHMGNGSTVNITQYIDGAQDPTMYAETLAREIRQYLRMS